MSYRTMRERLLTRPDVRAGYDKQVELNKLGRLMKRGRLESKLPQQELSEISGVAQGDISRLEIGSGEKGPTFDTLVRLAHAQGMHLVVELVPEKSAEFASITSDEDDNADAAAAMESQPMLREAF
jgi:transcriptional regulator with XRE-family HTH domain